MKIKWYGHAAFRVTTASGTSIIIDPYEPGAIGLSYGPITDQADIVLTSHGHADHNFTGTIKGTYTKVDKKGAYDLKGVKIRAIPTFHDPSKGSQRGANLVFVIEADNLTVVHLGDLGHTLDATVAKEIGTTDVLMVPVGSVYTIDAGEATQVMNAIRPAITLPMHYNTTKSFPLDSVDMFTKGKAHVKKVGASEIDVAKATLPKEPEVVILEHAN
jgi:L-ascorbate metabolism protein UlaG (beta-lactamase superfamily)